MSEELKPHDPRTCENSVPCFDCEAIERGIEIERNAPRAITLDEWREIRQVRDVIEGWGLDDDEPTDAAEYLPARIYGAAFDFVSGSPGWCGDLFVLFGDALQEPMTLFRNSEGSIERLEGYNDAPDYAKKAEKKREQLEEIKGRLQDEIDEVIRENVAGAPYGDIAPEQEAEMQDIVDKLSVLVLKVAEQNHA